MGNYGIFLIIGNAGFMSSTVGSRVSGFKGLGGLGFRVYRDLGKLVFRVLNCEV